MALVLSLSSSFSLAFWKCSLFKYDDYWWCDIVRARFWRWLWILVVVSVLPLLSALSFFGFKINDWSYYMYNLVNATNMLKEKSHIYGFVKKKWRSESLSSMSMLYIWLFVCISKFRSAWRIQWNWQHKHKHIQQNTMCYK